MADMSALIEICDVNKSYNRGGQCVDVLMDINLDILRGDYVSLMGPSGSGKSTLLNLIAGIDKPSGGSIYIDNINITTLSENQLAAWRAHHIGFIFQFYNLMPVLTAVENVELPMLLSDLDKHERRERAETLLQLVNLGERMDHRPNELSGGQQQRVSIARALAMDPTVIVADEPTGDLDRNSADEVLRLLHRLNSELGKTIVMVTHDAKSAAQARRKIHLEKGVLHAGNNVTLAFSK